MPGVFALVLALLLAVAAPGQAAITRVIGSNFEIDTDANLVVDGGTGSIDWLDGSVLRAGVTNKADLASGSGDDAFGQGTAEDQAVPTIVSGSIPPNKSDLTNYGFFVERNSAGSFLNLFWARVQDPKGTTNMDFEFNQSKTLSSNGVTPVRTANDVLIEYHLDNGGTNAALSLRYWTGSVWGPETALSTSVAIGSINNTAIAAANSGPLGSLSPRTFGEASINLASVVPAGCTSFGSAYVKSRSSDSFNAEIKDFIKPITLSLNNCGGITIVKNTVGGTGSFNYSTTGGSTVDSAFILTTTTPSNSATTTFSNASPGNYTVTEIVAAGGVAGPPAGWNFTSLTCTSSGTGTSASQDGTTATKANITLAAGGNVTCTYTNTKQATLTVTKTLVPSTDAGLFNLQIDGTTAGTGANVGDGGTTGALVKAPGTYTAGETAGTGTSLANYTTVIGGDCNASGSVTLAAGDNKTCTITNTRKLYTVIVLVCQQSDNTLYSSNVTLDGTVKNSLSAVPAALTGVTESDLCTKLTGGARYVDKVSGDHTAALTIPTTEATPTP